MTSTHTVTRTDLVSDEYLDQLQKMRKDKRPNWGNGGTQHLQPIIKQIDKRGGTCGLDYGCGHGNILTKLQTAHNCRIKRWQGYDPGMEQYSEVPTKPVDVLVSTDVLEHIEPDKLDSCLEHIRSLTGSWAYINVHTGPANAILPDGRNAHLIQEPQEWWHKKLLEYFPKVECIKEGGRPTFICEV